MKSLTLWWYKVIYLISFNFNCKYLKSRTANLFPSAPAVRRYFDRCNLSYTENSQEIYFTRRFKRIVSERAYGEVSISHHRKLIRARADEDCVHFCRVYSLSFHEKYFTSSPLPRLFLWCAWCSFIRRAVTSSIRKKRRVIRIHKRKLSWNYKETL